ncbi:M48 family metallopeptidase [Aromatoleum bremense]|uniref:M48 family metalloprotease n=1 Tax=Aromatoleum bremense TaxID=76115 RepID=A0ABX1NU11_9RHOO|nr:M48 family metallopeptidase [Aromatoleum bremense]NMG15050.1 M48 family metalloprotease [Aromatoleum bremense]QTQ32242.1 Peptidase, M48 family [Aromatoleum bremense]
MQASCPRLSRLRSRLARRLGLKALAGLVLVGCMALAFGAIAGHVAFATWSFLVDGKVVVATTSAAVSMVAFALAWRVLGWLIAPAACPDGVRLPREAARSLYAMIDQMSQRFGGIPVDAVWIGGDMNAAILQRPRWGWVGPIETHLIIGLPLAHSVSRRQFCAILAHEFAHLACQRQRLDAWGGHLRAWWFRVLDRCIDGTPLLGRGLEWGFAGDLRDALRLARIEEFEADAVAARVVGAGLVGEALVEVALKERFLSEDYWRKVMAQSRLQPEPSIRPYRDMGLGMMAGFRRPMPGSLDLRRWMAGDEEHVPVASFHPTVAERLRALRVRAAVSHGERMSVADACLAPLLPTLAWVFDRAWWEDSRLAWQRCYQLSRPV